MNKTYPFPNNPGFWSSLIWLIAAVCCGFSCAYVVSSKVREYANENLSPLIAVAFLFIIAVVFIMGGNISRDAHKNNFVPTLLIMCMILLLIGPIMMIGISSAIFLLIIIAVMYYGIWEGMKYRSPRDQEKTTKT
ncbi:MAG: hypothetical protein ABIH52_04305 [Candidatus Aenigmatarchaeota archaeon]|nr:hypothetical protein [Nanoarchaeota archaeon]